MPIAFHSAFLSNHSVEEAVDRVSAAGYDGIELNAETLPWAAPHVGPLTTATERRAIRRRCADIGLGISSICAHCNLVESTPEARRQALEWTRGCIDLAADLGVEVAHAISGRAAPGLDPAGVWCWLAEALVNGAEYAVRRGVRFGLEPHVGGVVHDLATARQMLKDVAPAPLQINFDPSHFQVAGDDLSSTVHTLQEHIIHVHVKDALGSPAQWEFPPLGRGAVDFPAVALALQGAGYRGWVSVEYEAQAFGYEETEETVLRNGLAFARRLFG